MPQKTDKLEKESSQNINDKNWQDGVSSSNSSDLTKTSDKSPVNEKIPQLSNYDLVIICGGEPNVNEEVTYPWLVNLKDVG